MRTLFVKNMIWCVLASLPAVMHISCKKGWLDEKTNKNLAVPATLNDFQTLLDNTDVMNENSCGIGEIGSDGHQVIPLYWPESDQEYNAYTWLKERPIINSPDWNAAYKRVAYCNLVLEGLDALHPGNASDAQWWRELKGEALFQRARTFFELAQVYAPAYTIPLPSGNWGIPLRLTTDVNEVSVRSTVKETYDRVINDLLAAKDLLPLTPVYKTRASKPAALAQLARVFLGMEAYDLAYTYADSCLRLYNNLLDYNTLDTLPAPGSYPVAIFNSEVLFHSTLVKWGIIMRDAMIDSALYALYDANDLRRTVFFDCSAPYIQFRGSYYGGLVLFSGLAADEQYLIRSECSVRMGDIGKGMDDIRTLLQKRYRQHIFVLPAVTNAKDALAIVLQERRKELLLRGLRWTDLRRLNHDPVYVQTITRFVGGKTYTLEPNSFKYTFPIPDDIIQKSGIAQNPGW